MALPVPLASIQVSYRKCTTLALHDLPDRSAVAEPVLTWALFLSLEIWAIARPTDEVGTSVIMSTLSVSYHWRAMLEPTSGLFWWSALTISTFKVLLVALM